MLGFLADYPQYGLFGVGMGNIHLYARNYLAEWALLLAHDVDWALSLAYNTVFVPNSGYLRIISELGIVGLILFLGTYLIPIRSNFKYRRFIHDPKIKSLILGLNIFAILVLVTYLWRYQHINYTYFILGLLYFLNRELVVISKKQQILT